VVVSFYDLHLYTGCYAFLAAVFVQRLLCLITSIHSWIPVPGPGELFLGADTDLFFDS
jgi:hypothetical protein